MDLGPGRPRGGRRDDRARGVAALEVHAAEDGAAPEHLGRRRYRFVPAVPVLNETTHKDAYAVDMRLVVAGQVVAFDSLWEEGNGGGEGYLNIGDYALLADPVICGLTADPYFAEGGPIAAQVSVGDPDPVWIARGPFKQPASIADPFVGPSGEEGDWTGGLLGTGLIAGDT